MALQFYVKGSPYGPKNLSGNEFDFDLLNGPVNYFPQMLASITTENTFVISCRDINYFFFCLVLTAIDDAADETYAEEDADIPYILYKPDRKYESAYYGPRYDSIEDGTFYNFTQAELDDNDNLDKALQFRRAILSHFPELPNFIYINRY